MVYEGFDDSEIDKVQQALIHADRETKFASSVTSEEEELEREQNKDIFENEDLNPSYRKVIKKQQDFERRIQQYEESTEYQDFSMDGF